ncbi:hypothetical protein MLD38_031791 [Melastoma candidum]|uniref:Uncharacterized protein n=1 Tax=Melastoma candidum TaxID=119954 RepID=A0ACB9MVE5_9MYRT|nr:hypothetical protein MLD38_031791 [Melastoma candidum]
MDRLVTADTKDVEIHFCPNLRSSASFRVTNLMHTMPVAVSLSTTNTSVFRFPEPYSILPPLSTATFTVSLKPSEEPPVSSPPDSIVLRSSILPSGKARSEELRRLFSRPGPHLFKDASLPIYFSGPDVFRSLLCLREGRRRQLPLFHGEGLDYLIDRAVRGCDASQLHALLRWAVFHGDAAASTCLIESGADVNRDGRGSDGRDRRSLGCLAVQSGNLEVLEILVAAGLMAHSSSDLVLHEAATANRVDMMEALWKGLKGLDINMTDANGRTPIHVAADNGSLEAIKFCVSVGGDVDVLDANGWSPLHYAARNGSYETVEYLVDHAMYTKHAVNVEGKTALSVAEENGFADLYGPLRSGDDLHRAARVGDVDGVRDSIAEGGNVNGRDQHGWTPLHRAAFKGRVECVKALLSHGAKVDSVDDEGYTPLQCALEAGHMQVALLLASQGGGKRLENALRDGNKEKSQHKGKGSLDFILAPFKKNRRPILNL